VAEKFSGNRSLLQSFIAFNKLIVTSFKHKTSAFFRRARNSWPIFRFLAPRRLSQSEVDKKLVYDLAPRKIPNTGQMKYLRKFLNPKEYLLVKVCLLIVLINAAYLATVWVKKHLQYLPVVGGTYVEGVVGYPKTINPLYAINRDVDNDLSYLIFSSLLRYNPDGRLINDLATQVDISADAKQYTVKIHDDAKWHNGEALTIDDVLFTFNLIKDPEYRSPLRSSLVNVQAEKIDEYTIKFILSEPYAPFTELLTFGILPKSIWSGISSGAAVLSDFNLKPVGSGPYKLQTYLKNKTGDLREYRLVVNPNYYGQKPYVKGIDFVFFADVQEVLKAFNDQQISGLSYLPINSRKELLAQNSLYFHELVQPQIVALFFNQEKNKTLADKDVRQALAVAIDKNQLVKDVFAGVYPLADGPILSNSQFYNHQLPKYSYNPEAAAATIKNKALTVTLTVVAAGNNTVVAEKIKSYWQAAGVQVNVKVVSGEQAANIIKDRDFEVILYGESVGGDPDVYAFWHSSQIGGKGLNLAGYNNSKVDTLLLEARASASSADRLAKYQQFQETLVADIPAIFLYSPTYTYVQSKEVSGFSGTMIINPADRFSSVSSWFMKTKKKFTW
jgi:peptide/nickel transport system substrate-binding protein